MLAFACLLHDVGKPATYTLSQEKDGSERIRFNEHDQVGAEMADAILRRLRFSNDEREAILACVDNHMTFKDVTQMRRATLRRLLARATFGESCTGTGKSSHSLREAASGPDASPSFSADQTIARYFALNPCCSASCAKVESGRPRAARCRCSHAALKYAANSTGCRA